MEVGRSLYETILIVMPDSTSTVAVFMCFIILYVTLNPDAQRKMQEEIDSEVRSDQMVIICQLHSFSMPL